MDGDIATVSLCVWSGMAEGLDYSGWGGGDPCFDGFDNDCNGLTDAEDPSCQVREHYIAAQVKRLPQNVIMMPISAPIGLRREGMWLFRQGVYAICKRCK